MFKGSFCVQESLVRTNFYVQVKLKAYYSFTPMF